jgi:uncharacterized protein with HEPN domain
MTQTSLPALLHDLLTHAERILAVRAQFRSRQDFVGDRTACDAVLWNLLVIGEVCKRLGDPFQQKHPHIPWRLIVQQRNVIAHGYDVLDWNRLAETIERDLPVLIDSVRKLLDAYGPPPET